MNDHLCSICFYKIKKSQMKTLHCAYNHSYHQKCIWRWLVKSNTCPLCRERVSSLPGYDCEYNEYIHYINALSPSSSKGKKIKQNG